MKIKILKVRVFIYYELILILLIEKSLGAVDEIVTDRVDHVVDAEPPLMIYEEAVVESRNRKSKNFL